ncbi:MAG: ATP/GTP-binding protein [Dehalococcoidia bacterium]
MFRSFTVRNFRCFRDLTVRPLERVNLVAGMNGLGKTALLEALFLHLGPNNPTLPLKINAFRGMEPYGPYASQMWRSLFHLMRLGETIELLSLDDQKVRRSLKIRLAEAAPERVPTTRKERVAPIKEEEEATLPPTPGALTTVAEPRALSLEYEDSAKQKAISQILTEADGFRIDRVPLELPLGIFLSARRRVGVEDVERFSNFIRMGRQGEVVTTLKLLEPRLSRLAVLVTAGTPLIHVDINIGELLPIQLAGQGVGHLLAIVVAIASARGGTVLIDEIENGLHHSVMVDVWKAIGRAARRSNTQVFATTHSRECIEAAHRAFEASRRYEFRLHRLERVKDKIEAITYDQESLTAALKADLEVR